MYLCNARFCAQEEIMPKNQFSYVYNTRKKDTSSEHPTVDAAWDSSTLLRYQQIFTPVKNRNLEFSITAKNMEAFLAFAEKGRDKNDPNLVLTWNFAGTFSVVNLLEGKPVKINSRSTTELVVPMTYLRPKHTHVFELAANLNVSAGLFLSVGRARKGKTLLLRGFADGHNNRREVTRDRFLQFHLLKYQEPASITDVRSPLEGVTNLVQNVFAFIAESKPHDVLLIDSIASLATSVGGGTTQELGIDSSFWESLIALHNFALFHNRLIIASFHPPTGNDTKIADLVRLLEAKCGGVFLIEEISDSSELQGGRELIFTASLRDGAFVPAARSFTFERKESSYSLHISGDTFKAFQQEDGELLNERGNVANASELLTSAQANKQLLDALATSHDNVAAGSGHDDQFASYQNGARRV